VESVDIVWLNQWRCSSTLSANPAIIRRSRQSRFAWLIAVAKFCSFCIVSFTIANRIRSNPSGELSWCHGMFSLISATSSLPIELHCPAKKLDWSKLDVLADGGIDIGWVRRITILLTERTRDVAHQSFNRKRWLERNQFWMSKMYFSPIRSQSLPRDAIPLWSNILLSACWAPRFGSGIDYAALARNHSVFREASIQLERMVLIRCIENRWFASAAAKWLLAKRFLHWLSSTCTGRLNWKRWNRFSVGDACNREASIRSTEHELSATRSPQDW